MKKALLMGILNTTPDSFYDKGKHYGIEKSLQHGIRLYKEGADIIDVGGESTRPGSLPISEEEELKRTLSIIEELRKSIPVPISIDTAKAKVAEEAVKAGASWINDVSGFQKIQMRELASSLQTNICVMHMQGNPKTMQKKPHYPEGVASHVMQWFEKRIEELIKAGVREEKITLDPGIGFGKTLADNIQILHTIGRFKSLGFPILLGVSRKSFMGKILGKTAGELLPATLVVNALALKEGVDIIRVHDVQEHRDVIDLLPQIVERQA